MAGDNTERLVLANGAEVVGREVDGRWQVHITDATQQNRPANAAVTEQFDKLMVARTASSRAGNEWGTELGKLMHYAELAGFKLGDVEPEAISAKQLDQMAQNPGLKPYVDNVRHAERMKTQFDTMEEATINRLEIAVENQLAGRGAAAAKISSNEIEQLNNALPDLRNSGIQRG